MDDLTGNLLFLMERISLEVLPGRCFILLVFTEDYSTKEDKDQVFLDSWSNS